MHGSEKHLNSGLIWPHGLTLEGLPPVESFTVNFEQAEEYDYICILHPWVDGWHHRRKPIMMQCVPSFLFSN